MLRIKNPSARCHEISLALFFFFWHNMAIYEQNLSKPTCFTADWDVEPLLFFVLLFYDALFRLNNSSCEALRFKFQNTTRL